jgi:CubicO group peptidase (beta-lactamase class C family)
LPLVLAAATALPATAPAAAQAPADRVDSAFVRLAGPTTPGCAVGVARDGRPLLERAYGMADLEGARANTAQTVFEAGSVTKQVTAAAVVLLALDGRFSLEDDARTLLPELPRYERTITIRHLLNHTSGLRDWGSVAALGGWPRGSRAYTAPDMLGIVARQRTLNYPPGDHYSYTNSGYSLLAVLVERASGMPFAEFTRARLLAPLGMTSTQWRDDYTRVVKGRAIAYQPAPDGFRLDMPFENVVGNGGLLTTVGDLLRWTENLESGVVGGPRFLTEMHRQARLTGGRQIEYASGLFVTSWRGIPEVSHSGSTGGYRAFLARYPRQHLAVAVLCNAAQANATALAHEVADAYLGDAPGAAVATRVASPGGVAPTPRVPYRRRGSTATCAPVPRSAAPRAVRPGAGRRSRCRAGARSGSASRPTGTRRATSRCRPPEPPHATSPPTPAAGAPPTWTPRGRCAPWETRC